MEARFLYFRRFGGKEREEGKRGERKKLFL